MIFLLIGIIFLGMKFLEIAPIATQSWWLVMAPFALAVVWWQFVDASGLTKKREIEKEQRKKKERLEKSRSALGLDARKRR